MTKPKINFLLDESIPNKDSLPQLSKAAKLSTNIEAGIQTGSSDDTYWKTAQKNEQIIITCDKKSGFSEQVAFNPTYNKTGVVVFKQQFEEKTMDQIAVDFASKVTQKDLTQARTELSTKGATISTREGKVEVEFKKT